MELYYCKVFIVMELYYCKVFIVVELYYCKVFIVCVTSTLFGGKLCC